MSGRDARESARRRAGAVAAPQPGQALVLSAMMMTVFLGMLAMMIDLGFVMIHRRLSQNAADAATLAAARLLAQSVSMTPDGETFFLDVDDAAVSARAATFFAANRLPTAPPSAHATALEYLSCSRASLGFSNASSPDLVSGAKLPAGAEVPGETCYVRANARVQFGGFFSGAIGRPQLAAGAQATARIAPTAMPPGRQTWPITRRKTPNVDPEEECPDSGSPCIFWAANGPGSTAIGEFKELLDPSRYSAYTGAAQQIADYDHDWPGTHDKTVDLPQWLRYGFGGELAVGNKVELFGGNLGNNNATPMRQFIADHSEGTSPDYPERGRFTTMPVFLWETGDKWNGSGWQAWTPQGGQPPDRVTLSLTRCFRFYENLVEASKISGYYVSCYAAGTPLAGPPSLYANTVQMVD